MVCIVIALFFMGGMSVHSAFQFRGTSKTTLLHHSQGREQAMMWPDCRGGRAGRPARLPRQCGQTERVVIIRRKKREEKRREGGKNKKLENGKRKSHTSVNGCSPVSCTCIVFPFCFHGFTITMFFYFTSVKCREHDWLRLCFCMVIVWFCVVIAWLFIIIA